MFHADARAAGRRAAAYARARTSSRRNPTLLGLDRLLEAQLLDAPPERRHDLELVKGLVSQHIKRLATVQVRQLRFSRAAVLLALPRLAQQWETYSPQRTEEKAVPA